MKWKKKITSIKNSSVRRPKNGLINGLMLWSNFAICERKDRDSLSILEGRSILGVKIILSEIPLFSDILL